MSDGYSDVIKIVEDREDGVNNYAATLHDAPNTSVTGYGVTQGDAVMDAMRLAGWTNTINERKEA